MTDHNPTPEQCARAARVQRQLMAEVSLLACEGVSPHEMIAGLGATIADVLTTAWGPTAVAPWFKNQAAMIESLQRPQH